MQYIVYAIYQPKLSILQYQYISIDIVAPNPSYVNSGTLASTNNAATDISAIFFIFNVRKE